MSKVAADPIHPLLSQPFMRLIYHLWLSASSRKVRIFLAEKGLEFDLKVEKIWERRTEFLAMNPAGDVPVLIEPDGTTLTDSQVICEYLDEVYGAETPLLGNGPLQRAETRRLTTWFDQKFGKEVTDNLKEHVRHAQTEVGCRGSHGAH